MLVEQEVVGTTLFIFVTRGWFWGEREKRDVLSYYLIEDKRTWDEKGKSFKTKNPDHHMLKRETNRNFTTPLFRRSIGENQTNETYSSYSFMMTVRGGFCCR